MRCKNHYTDLSSIVGVCASCLCQRLFALAVAQEHLQSQPHPQTLEDKIRRKTANSASELINQHSSHINRHFSGSNPCFFSTPQLPPTNQCRKKDHSLLRFSLLSKLFRSSKRSSDSNPDPRVSVFVSDYQVSCGRDDTATSATSTVPRRKYCSDRGMSPVRSPDCGGAEDDFFDSRKQAPWRKAVRRSGGGNGRSVSGLGLWLSPMVRVSPCRRWNERGVAPVDGGEIRGPVTVKGFCANRSRKVADFGRLDMNR